MEEDPSYNVFDVTSCYDDDSKIPFYIEFDGKFTILHMFVIFVCSSVI